MTKRAPTVPKVWLQDFGVMILHMQGQILRSLPERVAAAMLTLRLETDSSDMPALIRAALDRAVHEAGGLPHPTDWPNEKVDAWYSLIRPLGDPQPTGAAQIRERLAEITRATGTPWAYNPDKED